MEIGMMPDEVAQLRQALGDSEKSKAILAQIDAAFADSLDNEELSQLSDEIK